MSMGVWNCTTIVLSSSVMMCFFCMARTGFLPPIKLFMALSAPADVWVGKACALALVGPVCGTNKGQQPASWRLRCFVLAAIPPNLGMWYRIAPLPALFSQIGVGEGGALFLV